MKYRALFPLLYFVMFAFGMQNIQAQQSDYQITKDFQEQYKTLKDSVNAASSVAEVDSLEMQADSLKVNYNQHKKLLQAALYPSSYEEKMEDLGNIIRAAEHKLLIIENQNEKLAELSKKVSGFESEITNLNTQAESLKQAITTSAESERQLSDLVERYRNNLQERDELILTVVDSLLLAYAKLTPNDVSELSEGAEAGKLSSQDNPLQFIHDIIEENVHRLKTADESLVTEDYLRMYVVQDRFNEVWNQIGNELVTIYGGSEKEKWNATITKKLNDWRASVSLNMWESLNNYLAEENVQIEAFDNNESFYNALNTYVQNATKVSRDKMLTSDNYKEFENFFETWNDKIKKDWSHFMQQGEILTMAQISTIDHEIVNWRDEAKPRSFLIPIMLGISLLIIVGLVIVIAKK